MADRVSSVYLFFDDFESGMLELNSHERGVYFSLCLRYYATAGRLYDDDRTLARNCNCSLQAYRKTKAKLVELGKIAVVDGQIYQPRAEAELRASWDRLAKWKAWKSKKDQKKMQKSSQSEPENPNDFRPSEKQPKPEGVGFPLTGENPTPKEGLQLQNSVPGTSDNAPSPERGGALSSAASEALRSIGREASKRPHVSLHDVDELKRAVQEFDGTSFIIGHFLL